MIHQPEFHSGDSFRISPHSGGGSGLKPQGRVTIFPFEAWNLPSLRWGERIETDPMTVISLRPPASKISPHSGGGSGLKPATHDPRPAKSPLTPVGGAD